MSHDDSVDGRGATVAADISDQKPGLQETQQQQQQQQQEPIVFEALPIVPPDGGYGWVVVTAAFFVNLIADGVTFSFGILLSELFKSLDDTREDISWIGSFLAGIPLLVGPVTSLLIDRFGCRSVTLVGAVISGAGFILMYILPQNTLLYVFSGGLLSGFGLGLVFMPPIVAVSFYFLEKRALATGIATSGSGVGTVVFAYITRACIEAYSWRGSFLIVGGILLNVCICGALYRPLEPPPSVKRRSTKIVQDILAPGLDPLTRRLSDDPTADRNAANATIDEAEVASKSLVSIPTYLRGTGSCSLVDEARLIASLKLIYTQKQQKQQQQQQQKSGPNCRQERPRRETYACGQQQQQQQKSQQQQPLRLHRYLPVDRRHFLQQRAPRCRVPVTDLWDSCPEFPAAAAVAVSQPTTSHNEGPATVARTVTPAPAVPSSRGLLARCKSSKPATDARVLFVSWDYLAFLASNFLLYFWYDITYTFLPDHAKEIGLSNSDVSLVIGLIGVSNTIGQVAIGYVGDFPWVNSALLYALCMSLTGVANFLVPWCTSLASLIVYGIVYGFLVSANYALCSIVIIDLHGLDRLTTGYGFMMFFQGLANLLGPPAMGHMRDIDSDYNRAFIYSGIFVLASNLLILPVYRAMYGWAKAACRRICRPRPGVAGPALGAATADVTEPLASA